MRGVVTLAAVFVLPTQTPHREVLILVAVTVVGATLLVQGATLPLVLRRLGLGGPDPAEDALQAATVHQRATAAGLARLDEIVTDDDPAEVVDRVRRRSSERSDAMWERLGSSAETPSEAYARLRTEMIRAQRAELIRLRDRGSVHDDVLRDIFSDIDIEETVLDFRRTLSRDGRAEAMQTPDEQTSCEHLQRSTSAPSARPPDGCAECLSEGRRWVHLRLCMTCGHVGCCDSSPGRHASGHYGTTGHPVIRSYEANEAWRWCFLHEQVG
jgi:hypothetical protein